MPTDREQTQPGTATQFSEDPVSERFEVDSESLCHVDDGTELRSFCGFGSDGPVSCDAYGYEAICPTCGKPTCPICARLCALDDALEAA